LARFSEINLAVDIEVKRMWLGIGRPNRINPTLNFIWTPRQQGLVSGNLILAKVDVGSKGSVKVQLKRIDILNVVIDSIIVAGVHNGVDVEYVHCRRGFFNIWNRISAIAAVFSLIFWAFRNLNRGIFEDILQVLSFYLNGLIHYWTKKVF
jgi:hypothetical protein